MFDLTYIIILANDLNLIQHLPWKLVRQNEPAAKLDEALNELTITASAARDHIRPNA